LPARLPAASSPDADGVHASCGWAAGEPGDADLAAVLSAADAEMYARKAERRALRLAHRPINERGADVKQFACGAVVPGCDARFEGETEDEILRQVAEHARDAHGIEEPPPELVAAVQDGIEDRPA
jgi:predicted small metal-binding protein